ncbi:MAG: hypothetical protein E6R04_10230 [Spirochaetes bacterium]|nr:MAG: hypothetical protein E6R04_10230 [Spirochaetota bacterium]
MNFLIALAALAIPGFHEIAGDNPLTAIILTTVINVLLRLWTKEPVQMPDKKNIIPLFFLSLLISACAGVPQRLDPNLFYKRDLPLCVTGVGCYEGTTVLPAQTTYEIEIAPKGDANIDLLLVTSCHREESFEKTASGWFIFQKKTKFKYFYTPAVGIEDDGDCSLMVNTYEKLLGRHSWARLRFEHPKYQLDARLSCNGEFKQAHGVSVCQSKAGLAQRIRFDEPVMFEWDEKCAIPKKAQDGSYEIPVSVGECGYTVRSQSGKLHDLLTIGYEGVLVREIK